MSSVAAAALLAVPSIAALWHFLGNAAATSPPILNDMLLHLLEVQKVAALASDVRSDFGARALGLVDHVLGTHGLGFPLFHHYQHLPHIITGIIGAWLGDPDIAFDLTTAGSVSLLFPLSTFASLAWALDVHPVTAAFSCALLTIINDAPPQGQIQQGYQ